MTDICVKKSETGGIRRRDFLATGAATLALGVTGFPAVLRAQAEPVKIGLIHPVSGFIAFSGTQCRAGAEMAVKNLDILNKAAGSPAKTAMIVHEESLFGTGTANLLSEQLPNIGVEVLEVIKHANPTRDFTNIVLQIKSKKPDIIIPANYFNEYVLLARTLRQQKVEAKGIYSVLGGAASNYQFVKEFPEAADQIMDCNHWFNPKSELAMQRKKAAEAKGLFYTYEVFLTYNAVAYLADAIERAGSTEKEAVIAALRSSTWDKHGMPYGPTKIDENGQNTGAQPVNTQVLNNVVEVIYPKEFASAEPVFPMKA